jgi:cytoskeleton protein RodZ
MLFRRRSRLSEVTQNDAADAKRRDDAGNRRAPNSVGTLLRAERERQGLSLQDVAAALRLRRTMIEALETGQADRLPGPTYAVAFVRSYCDYLGLDRDALVAQFRQEVEDLVQPVELTFPISASESRLPGGAIVMASLVVAIGAYVAWYLSNVEQNSRPPRVAAVPPPLSALIDRPPAIQVAPAPSAQNAAAATVSNRPDPLADPEIDPAAQAGSRQTLAVAPLSSIVQPSEEAGAPHAAPTASFAGRIVLRATADCWLRIRDAAGTVLLTRMMKPGDELTPPDREGLSMFIGSAGALEVTVDGKRAPTLGPLGAVRRDVPLDPDRLLAGNADSSRPAMIAPAPPAGRQARPGGGG